MLVFSKKRLSHLPPYFWDKFNILNKHSLCNKGEPISIQKVLISSGRQTEKDWKEVKKISEAENLLLVFFNYKKKTIFILT